VLLARALAGHIPTVLDMTIGYAKRDGSMLKGSELGTGVLKRVFCGESPVGTVREAEWSWCRLRAGGRACAVWGCMLLMRT
jgi:hypothetical protein